MSNTSYPDADSSIMTVRMSQVQMFNLTEVQNCIDS